MSSNEIKLLSYGIIFGIVFMTFIYTMVRYLYTKEFSYLSYCLMQFFSLCYIIVYSSLFPFALYMQDLALILATLSSLAFAFTFYEGRLFIEFKNLKELVRKTVLLNIVILTAFYHYMLFEYLPYTLVYAVLLFSLIFNFQKKFKPLMIYVYGWSIFCFILFISDFKSYYLTLDSFDIVLLAFGIEAVLFTFWVTYSYHMLKEQTKDYEKMLIQQTKMAQSGEMIANITHQFRQPLNNLSYIFMNLNTKFLNDELSKVYFDKKMKQTSSQLNFMSKTIEDFNDFYTPSKHQENFFIKEVLQMALSILSPQIKRLNIDLSYDFICHDEVMIFGKKNELAQVLFALLSNACDALVDVENKKIKVTIKQNDALVYIEVQDNAQGIADKYLEQIFEPYFTTKTQGLGIGLYMCKTIIEDGFNGEVTVKTNTKGTTFTLCFEKTI